MKRLRFLSILLLCGVLVAQASELRIAVSKSERRLAVFRGETQLHIFPIGLGQTPVGDKERSGDGKTPEGRFYVCVKNARSQYYLSLGLSYPDAADAARGLAAGLITPAQNQRIVEAQRRKTTPPWDTALGGEIFIHGNGAGSDWTLGCIALENADMKTLFDLIEIGTPVDIAP